MPYLFTMPARLVKSCRSYGFARTFVLEEEGTCHTNMNSREVADHNTLAKKGAHGSNTSAKANHQHWCSCILGWPKQTRRNIDLSIHCTELLRKRNPAIQTGTSVPTGIRVRNVVASPPPLSWPRCRATSVGIVTSSCTRLPDSRGDEAML